MTMFLRVFFVGLLAWMPLLHADDVLEPEVMLEQTAQRMIKALREQDVVLREEPARLYALVNKELVPHIDFEVASRWVLGRHWRAATPIQRQRFAREFKDMLVRFYSSALLEYSEFEMSFFPSHRKGGERQIMVRSNVLRKGGSPVSVNYSLVWRGGEWRVYDVTIEGISAVATYRSSFATEIQRNGLDALLNKMGQWNKEGGGPEGVKPPVQGG